MPRQKRASEKELNKDIYDAGEEDRFAEVPDPGQGMSRASDDVMKQRKIFKVRRKFGGGGGGGSSASAPKPAASSNPFASTNLAQPKSTSVSPTSIKVVGNEPPSKPNPFANIAFVSNSKSATNAPKPQFSFGSTPSSTAPKPSNSNGFSFASSTAPSSMKIPQPSAGTSPLKSLLSTPKSQKNRKQRIKELNQNFLHMIVDHWEGRMHAADYSHFMKEYQEHEERLQISEGEDGLETVAAHPTAGTSTITKDSSKPSSSWAAPAPSPAEAKPFSFGASAAQPTGNFSFAFKSGAAPAAGAPAAPSFSFGAPPPSSTASAPSAASNGDNDDPTSNPDDGKVEKIEQEENTEEEVLFEVRAKHIKFENKQWKKYGAGVLRLYRHKVTPSKCRMVIRNGIGKVQFNVGVSKGMKFEKVIKESKKGPATYVKFLAIEDASKGLETFMLQVKPDCLDKLHKTLEGMVA